MGLFTKKLSNELVQGRAFVVPTSTGNLGSNDEGNYDNTSHRAEVRTVTRLVLRWVADGGPMPTDSQRVELRLSNWLRIVMHQSGTNSDLAASLPAELNVPVWVDSVTRRIDSIDTAVAEAELEPYREVARDFWKQTEAPLASVRSAVALPGMAIRGLKGLKKEWRSAVSDLKADLSGTSTPKEPTAEETEQLRRTAITLGYSLEQNPKQHAKVRASALQAGPMIAESTQQGAYGVGNFENWLMLQTLSRVITAEEAAAFRRAAGLSD